MDGCVTSGGTDLSCAGLLVPNECEGTSMVTHVDLMTRNIEELDALFQASQSDDEALAQLEGELRYRLALQALTLLVEVLGVRHHALAAHTSTGSSAGADYSCRSASIGSIRAARVAGK
jgi:hypothetical protein